MFIEKIVMNGAMAFVTSESAQITFGLLAAALLVMIQMYVDPFNEPDLGLLANLLMVAMFLILLTGAHTALMGDGEWTPDAVAVQTSIIATAGACVALGFLLVAKDVIAGARALRAEYLKKWTQAYGSQVTPRSSSPTSSPAQGNGNTPGGSTLTAHAEGEGVATAESKTTPEDGDGRTASGSEARVAAANVTGAQVPPSTMDAQGEPQPVSSTMDTSEVAGRGLQTMRHAGPRKPASSTPFMGARKKTVKAKAADAALAALRWTIGQKLNLEPPAHHPSYVGRDKETIVDHVLIRSLQRVFRARVKATKVSAVFSTMVLRRRLEGSDSPMETLPPQHFTKCRSCLDSVAKARDLVRHLKCMPVLMSDMTEEALLPGLERLSVLVRTVATGFTSICC